MINVLLICVFLHVAFAHLSTEPGPFMNSHLLGSELDVDPSCSLTPSVDGKSYDLQSLSLAVGGWIANSSAVSADSFCLNLCLPVTSERNCVCYPCGGNQYPVERVARINGANTCVAIGGTLNTPTYSHNQDGQLQLLMPGGKDLTSDTRISSQITFICDPQGDQYNAPALVSIQKSQTENGSNEEHYMFDWIVPEACPTQ